MAWSSCFAAVPLLLPCIIGAPTAQRSAARRSSDLRFAVKTVEATREAVPLHVSDNVLALKSAGVRASGSAALHRALNVATTDLLPSDEGNAYNIDVEIAGRTFSVILDTGSSDLWLADQNVKCVDVNKTSQPQSACAFGPLAANYFPEGQIQNENFNITYGDGEFLAGLVGYEKVTVAGITVDHQEAALVNYAYWEGDNVTSGLIGFAYPSLTSAFPGTNPAVDNPNNTDIYNPWVFSAIRQGLISSSFSLAIERGANGGGGQLALGGLPTVSFNHSFTSVPLQILELIPKGAAARNYSFYTIIPDGFLLKGTEESWWGYHSIDEHPNTNFPVIVDSGTTLTYLPEDVAEAINSAYDPPSIFIEEEGVYENYCDATPPTVAIRIGGTDFYISSEDLLLQGNLGYDPETGGCVTGIQPSVAPYILGDTFLKNVVAVFDIGASEMRFAPHENY